MTRSKRLVPKRRFKEFDGAKSWDTCELKEVATFSKGKGYSKNDLQETGTPIILYGSLYTNYQTVIHELNSFVEDKENSIYSLGNEILVPSSGETAEDIARASVIAKKGVILGGDLNVMRVESKHDPVFLALSISNGTSKKELIKRAQGKSVVHLYNTDLKEMKFLFPAKIEQIQIRKFFRNLDNLISLQQEKIKKFKALKSAYLSDMFPKEGEKYPKLRFKGFTEPWEKRDLNFLANRYDNLRIPVTASRRIPGNTPYYGANGIQDYVKGFTHNGEYVLVAEDGANDLKDYPIHYVNGKVWVNNHAHVIQAKQGISDNKFLMYVFKIINIEPFLAGGSRAKLNANIMMNIEFTLPTLKEQIRISKFLFDIDKLITLHQQKLEKLENLKKAYLNEMFV